MIRELIDQIKSLQEKIAATKRLIDFSKINQEVKVIEKKMVSPRFWDEPANARKQSQLLEELKEEKDNWQKIEKDVQELLGMAQLAEQGSDEELAKDIGKKLREFVS